MSAIIKCPRCQADTQIRDELLGKNVRCPRCQQVFLAELPEVALEPVEEVMGVALAEEQPVPLPMVELAPEEEGPPQPDFKFGATFEDMQEVRNPKFTYRRFFQITGGVVGFFFGFFMMMLAAEHNIVSAYLRGVAVGLTLMFGAGWLGEKFGANIDHTAALHDRDR